MVERYSVRRGIFVIEIELGGSEPLITERIQIDVSGWKQLLAFKGKSTKS
jgi:hypothetical protein